MQSHYGTGIEIWAEFGPVDFTEKKIKTDYEQLLRPVFSCFHGQKQKIKICNQKHCSVHQTDLKDSTTKIELAA